MAISLTTRTGTQIVTAFSAADSQIGNYTPSMIDLDITTKGNESYPVQVKNWLESLLNSVHAALTSQQGFWANQVQDVRSWLWYYWLTHYGPNCPESCKDESQFREVYRNAQKFMCELMANLEITDREVCRDPWLTIDISSTYTEY